MAVTKKEVVDKVESVVEKAKDEVIVIEKAVENGLVEVKLKLGEIEHDAHLVSGLVRFKAGVATVEKEIADELKKLGLIH